MLTGAGNFKQSGVPPVLRLKSCGNKFHSTCLGDRARGPSTPEPSCYEGAGGPCKRNQSEKARGKQQTKEQGGAEGHRERPPRDGTHEYAEYACWRPCSSELQFP